MNVSRQRSLLAVVMLVILAGSVGAAWLLVHRGSAASAVLEEMRSKGLATYWGQQHQTLFYLISDGNRPVGWIVRRQGPAENGYSGQDIVGPSGSSSKWTLSNDATTGQYLSVAYSDRRKIETDTTLGKVRLAVRQTIGNDTFQGEVLAPVNYIPEGAMELVIHLVARNGRNARFTSIIDKFAFREVEEGEFNLVELDMTPQNANTVRVVQEITVKGVKETIAKTYDLDDHGQVVKEDTTDTIVTPVGRQIGHSVTTLTTGQELLKIFKDDDELKAQVADTSITETHKPSGTRGTASSENDSPEDSSDRPHTDAPVHNY